jgi:uncharacterized protein YkwD
VPADPAVALLNSVPVRALVGAEHNPASNDARDNNANDNNSDDSSSDDSTAAYTADVLKRTNQERRDAGCADLVVDDRLTRTAQDHAADMAENDYFAHESQDGTRFDTRIRAAGYARPAGENIAKGQTSAKQVVREWMASAPHRHNIENCAFTTIGLGYKDDYWVQDFGR